MEMQKNDKHLVLVVLGEGGKEWNWERAHKDFNYICNILFI